MKTKCRILFSVLCMCFMFSGVSTFAMDVEFQEGGLEIESKESLDVEDNLQVISDMETGEVVETEAVNEIVGTLPLVSPFRQSS